MEMERKKYRNTGRNTKRLWTEGRKCDKGVTRRRREEDGGRRGWETLECNLKSFLVKLRETRAAMQTWGTKGGGQSGLETMMGTRRPILIMESAQVKPSRFSPLFDHLFFASTWPRNFNRAHPYALRSLRCNPPLSTPDRSPTRLQENIDGCRITIRRIVLVE